MFIDIDDEHVIHSEDVISILDIQLKKSSIKLKKLLRYKKENNQLIGILRTSKSIIITDNIVYYSPLSTATLKKRFSMTDILNKLDHY